METSFCSYIYNLIDPTIILASVYLLPRSIHATIRLYVSKLFEEKHIGMRVHALHVGLDLILRNNILLNYTILSLRLNGLMRLTM